MNIRIIIDKAGRVVIPKPLREELHLEPGDALELETAGEQITLRPFVGLVRSLRSRESGCSMADSPSASATDEMLQQIREERDLANLSKTE